MVVKPQKPLVLPDFDGFKREQLSLYGIMTESMKMAPRKVHLVYEKIILSDTLGEVLSAQWLSSTACWNRNMLVTYFFNGGKEEPFEGEETRSREILLKYYLGYNLRWALMKWPIRLYRQDETYDMIILNFANQIWSVIQVVLKQLLKQFKQLILI